MNELDVVQAVVYSLNIALCLASAVAQKEKLGWRIGAALGWWCALLGVL